MLEPIVGTVEEFWLARLIKYQVQRTDLQSVEFRSEAKSYRLNGLTEKSCEMAVSRHERPTISAVFACADEGAVVWDVGANIGFYSCLLSQIVGETGKVFAFEPNPDAFMELMHQLSASRLSNVHPLEMALSNSDGPVQMVAPPEYTSASRIISPDSTEHPECTFFITARRGDSLVGERITQQPSFIKIDVEGHEISVLLGMQEILRHRDLRGLLCEIHFSILDANGAKRPADQIRRLLKDCGLINQQWISRSHLLARK